MSDGEGEDEFVQQKPTLIIFHGPPCIGKTSYYKEFYEKMFVRFSLAEWLERGEEASLHSGIRRLAKKLKDGDSVILDDCNPTAKGRASIVAALKTAGADFVLEGIEFRPQGGLAQARVGAEFVSAAEAAKLEDERLHMTIDIDSSDEESEDDSASDAEESGKGKKRGLERILSSDSELQADRRRQETLKTWAEIAEGLTYDEGFKLVQYIEQPLKMDISFERSHPGLFLDAQAMMSFQFKKGSEFDFEITIAPGIADNVREWMAKEPNGRVIVMIDDETFLPATISDNADSPETQSLLIQMCHDQMMLALSSIRLEVPLYYYHVKFGAFEPKDFQRANSLGPVAWLLRRHQLSLENSLWVSLCPKNETQSVPWGIAYIPASEFFSTETWDMDSKLRRSRVPNTSLPEFATEIVGKKVPTDEKSNAKARISPPLFAERLTALEANAGMANDWIPTSEEISFGRVHGCIFPPFQSAKKRASDVDAEQCQPKRPAKQQAPQSIILIDSSSMPIDVDANSDVKPKQEAIVVDSLDS